MLMFVGEASRGWRGLGGCFFVLDLYMWFNDYGQPMQDRSHQQGPSVQHLHAKGFLPRTCDMVWLVDGSASSEFDATDSQ